MLNNCGWQWPKAYWTKCKSLASIYCQKSPANTSLESLSESHWKFVGSYWEENTKAHNSIKQNSQRCNYGGVDQNHSAGQKNLVDSKPETHFGGTAEKGIP